MKGAVPNVLKAKTVDEKKQAERSRSSLQS